MKQDVSKVLGVPTFAHIHFYKVNLALSNQVEELWNKIVAEHGPIHILVNNAAICNGRSIGDLSFNQFKLTMEINFMS